MANRMNSTGTPSEPATTAAISTPANRPRSRARKLTSSNFIQGSGTQPKCRGFSHNVGERAGGGEPLAQPACIRIAAPHVVGELAHGFGRAQARSLQHHACHGVEDVFADAPFAPRERVHEFALEAETTG